METDRKISTTFKKGKSGNPVGRPKTPLEVKNAFREHTISARNVLIEVMLDQDARPGERIRAAEVVLNRAWGTPEQAVTLNGSVASVNVDTSKLEKKDQDALLNAIVGIYGNNEEETNDPA